MCKYRQYKSENLGGIFPKGTFIVQVPQLKISRKAIVLWHTVGRF